MNIINFQENSKLNETINTVDMEDLFGREIKQHLKKANDLAK